MWEVAALYQALVEWWELILSVMDIWFIKITVTKLGSCCTLVGIFTLSMLLKAIISSFRQRDKHDDGAIV
jgi:hypothetical protein